MIDLDQTTIAAANDVLVERYMECVCEIALSGYSALVVSEMVAIHQACATLIKLHETMEDAA